MRTTIELDPLVLAAARRLAERQSISLGRAVSELALRGLRNGPAFLQGPNSFPVFAVSPDGAPITDSKVRRLLDMDG